ncbi:UNVERIFIED_CONTAM: hypothetical protein K2H54_040562 [Gekko kuhli]
MWRWTLCELLLSTYTFWIQFNRAVCDELFRPPPWSSADCYHITTTTLVGIVAGDILLTVLLLIPIYYCTRRKGKTLIKKGEAKNYVNMLGIRT